MMRTLKITLVLTACTIVAAQDKGGTKTEPKTEKTPAAKRFDELSKTQADRYAALRGLGQEELRTALAAAQKTRVEELHAFLGEFPKGPEARKARLEIAATGARVPDVRDAGVAALKDLDLEGADLPTLVQAASLAGKLEVATTKTAALEIADAVAAKSDVGTLLGASEAAARADLGEQSEAWLEKAHASAKSDDERAQVAMTKAKIARGKRDDAKAKAIYAEVAASYPDTKSGRIAKGKLAAADLKVGGELIPFTGKDLDGKDVGPADYQGKVLLIDFWATWCGPCMKEMPSVVKAYEEHHAKGFDVLGISLDRADDRQKLVDCLRENDMPWRQIYDGGFWEAEVAQIYDVNSIPFTILVGRDGKILGKNLRGEKLEEAVRKAVSED